MREVVRNGGPQGYGADQAAEATRERARRHKQERPATPPASVDRYGRDPRAVEEFTGFFNDLLTQQGLPRMMARVLTCLHMTDSGTLTAAELVQRLRISPASVSHAVTFLERQGMLTRERLPGERRERYVMDDEIWVRSLLAALQMNDVLTDASRRGAAILGPGTPAGARFESSAELLLLVGESHRQAIEKWKRGQAAREARRADDVQQ